MTEQEEKERFAELLMRTPDDPFKAALALFPNNTPRALRIATEWANDPVVMNFRRTVRERDDEMHYLPSKADLAREIWNRLQGVGDSGPEDEDFVKLAKLYGDVMGFIEKPQSTTTVNVQQNRVMVVKDHGSDEEWQKKALEQQRKLINGEFTVVEPGK